MNVSDTNTNDKIKTGFKIPENYFEELSGNIMAKLPNNKISVVPLYRKRQTWMAIAAVLIVGLCLSVYFQLNKQTSPDSEALENYLVYQANITSYDIAEGLNNEDIAELENSINTVSNEAIEDYFSGNSDFNNDVNK